MGLSNNNCEWTHSLFSLFFTQIARLTVLSAGAFYIALRLRFPCVWANDLFAQCRVGVPLLAFLRLGTFLFIKMKKAVV